jgi:hypothetical protein
VAVVAEVVVEVVVVVVAEVVVVVDPRIRMPHRNHQAHQVRRIHPAPPTLTCPS